MTIYQQASLIVDKIESELKRLHRWSNDSLPEDAYENMGAFGSNSMSFEQWLQFVLIPRIQEIAHEQGEFPYESNLATYAIRYFDGDYDADPLREILYQLDQLINQQHVTNQPLPTSTHPPTVMMGDTTIPEILYSVADVLPQYELEHLESQLQTFDIFLGFLSPTVRPAISAMLMKAAIRTTHPESKKRIQKAAQDIADGKRAAPPYIHTEPSTEYDEEHHKNFPPQAPE